MDERVIELNLPAKAKYLEHFKKQRRNEMAKWRKCSTILFQTEADYTQWLDYTKWHKRPMKKSDHYGMLKVDFLDHPHYKVA